MIPKLRERALKMAGECPDCGGSEIIGFDGGPDNPIPQPCHHCAPYRELVRELESYCAEGHECVSDCHVHPIVKKCEDCMEWIVPILTIPYIRSVLKRLGLWDEFKDFLYENYFTIGNGAVEDYDILTDTELFTQAVKSFMEVE